MIAPRSLADRLTWALVVAVVALVGGAHVFVASAAHRSLAAEFDRSLLDQARNLATLVEQENGKVEFDYVARFHPEFERDAHPDYFQVSMADGLLVLRSKHLTNDLVFDRVLGDPWFGDAVLADGRSTRFVVYPFLAELGGKGKGKGKKAKGTGTVAAVDASTPIRVPEAPHPMVLVVLRGDEPLVEALGQLRTTTWIVVGLTLVLGAVLFRLLVQRGLRPVRAIAEQVRTLDVDTAERRITLGNAPTELQPVVVQTNALLERLHDALQRERRFTGNIAHELRTPVAELRTLAEVARRWPDDPAAVRTFFGDVAAVSERMGRVIQDLLLLARCQGGAELGRFEAVALLPAVHDALRRTALLQPEHAVAIDIDAALRVHTDAGKFGIVLDNLLGNAFSHGLPGTPVQLRAGGDDTRFWLEVSNAAAPLAAHELPRLEEPFWRAEASRASADHAGLGLALVHALANVLQLRVACTQATDGTFTARVEGPVALAVPQPQRNPTTPFPKSA